MSLAKTHQCFSPKTPFIERNTLHPAVIKKTPLNTEMNSVIRANAVIVIICFIVNRKEILVSLFVQKGFRNLFLLHIISLSADLKLRTRRQHAATQIPACIWTHYNSEPIWAALQDRTRGREKEGGQKRMSPSSNWQTAATVTT